MGLFSLPKHPRFIETYLSGFPNIKYQTTATIDVEPEKIRFKLLTGFKSTVIEIPASDILELGFNQETYRNAGKAAAGAIIGGVLTGGIGLLAGAALGGKRKQDNHLTLAVNYQGAVCFIELKPSKTIPKLYQELKKFDLVKEAPQPTETSQADELTKFAELRDKGIITDEEFNAKKKQILGL